MSVLLFDFVIGEHVQDLVRLVRLLCTTTSNSSLHESPEQNRQSSHNQIRTIVRVLITRHTGDDTRSVFASQSNEAAKPQGSNQMKQGNGTSFSLSQVFTTELYLHTAHTAKKEKKQWQTYM